MEGAATPPSANPNQDVDDDDHQDDQNNGNDDNNANAVLQMWHPNNLHCNPLLHILLVLPDLPQIGHSLFHASHPLK